MSILKNLIISIWLTIWSIACVEQGRTFKNAIILEGELNESKVQVQKGESINSNHIEIKGECNITNGSDVTIDCEDDGDEEIEDHPPSDLEDDDYLDQQEDSACRDSDVYQPLMEIIIQTGAGDSIRIDVARFSSIDEEGVHYGYIEISDDEGEVWILFLNKTTCVYERCGDVISFNLESQDHLDSTIQTALNTCSEHLQEQVHFND